jgi:hypothetical protein
MKPPLHTLNRIYPNGFTWHIWKNQSTGELRNQHRPLGADPFPMGAGWELVKSTPHKPKLCPQKLLHHLHEGL